MKEVTTTPEETIPEGAVLYTGPMSTYKVIGEIFPLNMDGSKKEVPLEMGSIHELPKGAGDQMVEEGTMMEMVSVSEVTTTPEENEAISNVPAGYHDDFV